ncbi:hypothetical protein V8C42DRAFT_320083 [Trichoderma barbatum]
MVVQTRRRKALQEAVVDEDADITQQPIAHSSPAKKLSVKEKKGEAEVPAKGTLMVFGDDDEAPVEPVSKIAAEPTATEEAEEEEDSDDEAPEAVSTTKAAEDIKKSAQAAQKAALEQAATQKRKRQQRDDLLKKQAEERKKADESKPQAEQPEARQTESGARGRKRAEKSQIPTVLPAEFLTDSSSEDEEDDSTGVAAGPKRRKVSGVEKRLTRLDAGPKDEVVKSTVYRVAKKTDERLAPKLKKHTKSSKDLLLKRSRPAAKSGTGTGFFKRK